MNPWPLSSRLGRRQSLGSTVLDDASGKTHWASAAVASSTNAAPNERALFTALIVSEQRIRRLELEVRQLRDALVQMQKKKED